MARVWKIHRQQQRSAAAERQWDRAYQLLVRWGLSIGAEPSTQLPQEQEKPNACRTLRSSLNPTASADPHH